jgi:hypothetical protein
MVYEIDDEFDATEPAFECALSGDMIWNPGVVKEIPREMILIYGHFYDGIAIYPRCTMNELMNSILC